MKRAAAPVPGPGRYTVDAAAKALELLSTFSFHERRLSLSELAARTGIPRATAFRLLSTLEAARFVTKASGEYQLGLKCFMLGNVVAADLDLREIARPHLVRARTGAILPAFCTALGKTLLAYEPRAAVAAWAATQTFAALTPHTITSARRLLKELRATRERGYGIDEQERELGVRCVAAPVRNHEGRIVAAISVAGPTERMPRTLVDSDVATTVVAAAQAISLDLGAESIAGYDAAQPAHGGRR